MFQELKYAVNIFACVITQLHVLHTALSVPHTMMTYLQVDLVIYWLIWRKYTEIQHTFEFIKDIYEFAKSSDQWYEKSIKMDVKSILLCNSDFPNSAFRGVLQISCCER